MSPSEHGAPRRIPAAEVPTITGLRLSPHGAEAKLVNISTGGLLCECAIRLKIGLTVQVLFEGGFTPASAAGRIARSEVAAMGAGGLYHHVAIEFNSPLALEIPDIEEPVAPELAAVSGMPLPPSAPAAVVRNRW